MHASKPDIAYWLAATRLVGVGPVTVGRWLNKFGNIKALFAASIKELAAASLSAKDIHALHNPDWQAVEQDMRWSQQPNRHLLAIVDPAYPSLLRELNDAPLVLYIEGQVEKLNQPQLAIVGSRNPTGQGKEIAKDFAYNLVKAGLIVTSGLALGIDAASHQGALLAAGSTVAVMGAGLSKIYPASHQRLAADIAQQGVLVSEFSPDTPPIAKNFPRRNRIISGLSLGVLVIEAAIKSGSLITARYAAEQGREVFAVPGSIHNPLARGCHHLIRQGAKLIETTQDILEELGSLRAAMVMNEPVLPLLQPTDLTSNHQQLLAQIGYEATALDTIIIRSGLTSSQVSSILLALELRNYVRVVTGGYARIAQK
jgi:DNA processing protein